MSSFIIRANNESATNRMIIGFKKHFQIINLICLLFCCYFNAQADEYENAFQLMQNGQYEQAIITLNQLIETAPSVDALVQRGESYRILGRNKEAIKDLEQALALAEKNKATERLAIVQISLGQAYLQNQQLESALKVLLAGNQNAIQIKRNDLIAVSHNLLGNLYNINGDIDSATKHYTSGLKNATIADDNSLKATLLINLVRLDNGDEQKKNLLYQAAQEIQNISNQTEQNSLLIALGYQAIEHQLYKLAYSSLSNAAAFTKTLKQTRLSSEANGYLGKLYEHKQRYNDALIYTEIAIQQAQKISAYDLLLQWEWQQGRLQKNNGQPNAAITSYRRAVNHIQTIRNDIPVQYHDGKSSFRATLAPIYLDLVELLIEHAEKQPQEAQKQELLTEALNIVERFKTAEMQDYFKDACAVDQAPLDDLNAVAPGSAVIYPIIFSDKIELLIQIGNKKYHKRVDSPLKIVNRLSFRVNAGLRPLAGGYFRPYSKRFSKQLYDLLILPWEKELKAENIHTLVYAPDGFLRQLPLGALWTGDHYLIEDYAVVTVPGLTLMEMKSEKRQHISALVAGVSRPGEVVNELPEEMQQILSTTASTEKVRGITRSIKLRALPGGKKDNEAINIERPLLDETKDKIQTALELPGVVDEVKEISDIMSTKSLVDENFLLENFEQEFAKSYGIVHIASHGLFSGTPEKSFLVAYDRVLNMSKLEELFKSEAFSDSPVEILTLSACQTAEGDDRSPLGLSGVALKSGARSALGSLWPVADVVAKQLLPDFYNNLNKHQMTKAKALQAAKIKLLKQEDYSHPGLWASFILIGNWL